MKQSTKLIIIGLGIVAVGYYFLELQKDQESRLFQVSQYDNEKKTIISQNIMSAAELTSLFNEALTELKQTKRVNHNLQNTIQQLKQQLTKTKQNYVSPDPRKEK